MSESAQRDIQESFFDSIRRERSEVVVYLINGIRLRGRIKSFDRFTFVLESEGHDQLIFKHAVSTVGVPDARDAARRQPEATPFNAPRAARAGGGGAAIPAAGPGGGPATEEE
jgi:host factor-I protein